VTTLSRVPVVARWIWPPQRFAALLLGLVWLLLASPYPPSLRGTGMVLIFEFVVLNVILGVGSGWLAFARTSTLDQRQVAVRNRAYHLGFLLIGAGIVVMIALSIAGGFAPPASVNHSLSDLPMGIRPRQLVALLELLVIAPTALIAWMAAANPGLVARRKGRLRSWVPALSIPLLAVVWFIAVAAMPARTVTVQVAPDGLYRWGATCGHFAAKKEIGYGFGGAFRTQDEVCWNGEHAYIDSAVRTDCGPMAGDADFAVVSVACTWQGNGDGTMLMIARGHISPLPGRLGARDVEIRLIVAPSGGVVSFG
jgi:hypothetical protein